MTSARMKQTGVAALAAWCVIGGTSAYAQDTLERAKTVYASAAYEDALTMLDALHTNVTPADAEEVAAYQLFCLMALGRTDEARHAIENIVRIDPMYHPSDAQVSPRVLSFFEDVRRPLLPQIVRDTYAKAKADFDQKDLAPAVTEFDRVIAIVDDMGSPDKRDASLADLRTLATGFRDLAKSASAPPPPAPTPAPPAPASTSPGPSVPSSGSSGSVSATVDNALPDTGAAGAAAKSATDTPTDPNHVYGSLDLDVKPPTAITQDMPAWNAASAQEKKATFNGVLELVIDEEGRVTSSSMRTSALPSYDAVLIRAATAWRFKPAMRNGVPVKYRLHMRIQLGR